MRNFCGTPDRTATRAGFKPNPEGAVWPKRRFTYAFDPERNPKDLPVKQARAAVRRAFGSWEEGGAELVFTEVGIDEQPDVTVQWVPGLHEGPGDEHDTMIDTRDDNGNPIPPSAVAHALYPPALTDTDFTRRYICFDDEEQTWVVAPDTDNDDTADDPMPSEVSDVEEVAVHEIGHFLGLDHSVVAGAVMQSGVKTQRSLGADDIAGIQDLYPPQGRVRFNAIWTKGSIPRKALQKIDSGDLKARLDAEEEQGWQPVRITSYQEPGQPRRYNVVLEETDRDLRWSSGKTREEFRERDERLTADGYELVFVHSGAGQAWSGVWQPDQNEFTRMEYTDDDPVGAPERLEEAIGNVTNARPMDVETYVGDDGRFYGNLMFWKNPTPFRVHLGETWENFLERLDDLESDWGVTAVDGYVLPDGSDRWNLIVQRGDFSWRVRAGYGGSDITNEITHLEARGFEAWALSAYVLPEPASTASLTAATVVQDAPPLPTLAPVAMGAAVDASRAYFTRYLQDTAGPAGSNQPGNLVVVDRSTLELVHPGVLVGDQPRHVAVNPVTGRIYVVNWGKHSYGLTVVDGASFEIVATIELKQGPLQVAVNPTTNRVYVTNWFQGRVHVIDGETHQQLPPIELGKGPVGIDVDPSRNQVYVAVLNRSVAPFRTGLQRITDHGGGGYAVEPFVDMLPLGTQPQDVAVDPANDRVYVANLGGGGVAPSVWVFHRSDLDLLATVRLTSPGRAIAVNGSTREVYVATDRGIEIIDGAANRWLRRIDGHPSWNIAAAPGNARQLFLAERNGSLSRLA